MSQTTAAPVPPTNVTVTSIGSSLDLQVTTLGFVPGPTQPNWPTIWPPGYPVAPAVHLDGGVIPWGRWIDNLAVRPHPTDPPPTPHTVSIYPGV